MKKVIEPKADTKKAVEKKIEKDIDTVENTVNDKTKEVLINRGHPSLKVE